MTLSCWRLWRGAIIVLLLAFLSGCGSQTPPLPKLAADDVVLAFGDSLTFGTGADPNQAYPAHLQQLIGRSVVNAGVPGETSAGGLKRLPEVLDAASPRLMILCLGGNDMLQRVDSAETITNLRAMLQLARERGVAVVLMGVPELKLLGGPPEYYAQLADEFKLPYEGVVLNDVLKTRRLKSDAIHANAEGYRVVAEALATLLKDTGAIE